MIKIKAEHDDKIFRVREFIQQLEQVQEEKFKLLYEELVKDGFPENLEDWLFSYIFNEDAEVTFEEYLDIDYMKKLRSRPSSDPHIGIGM